MKFCGFDVLYLVIVVGWMCNLPWQKRGLMGKRFAIVAIVFLLILAVLGWRFAVASREAILPGVRVMGVDVGGMSAAEAEAHLRSQVPAPDAIRLPLRTEAQTWHLTWAEVG